MVKEICRNIKLHIAMLSVLFLGLLVSFCGCSRDNSPADVPSINMETSSFDVDNSEIAISLNSPEVSEDTDLDIDNKLLPVINNDDLVSFDPDNSFSYCDKPVCRYDKNTGLINYTIHFNSVPKGDDSYIYLYEVSTYEDDLSFEFKPFIAKAHKDYSVTISFEYTKDRLFKRFIPVIFYEGNRYPLSYGQYITNPEDISDNNTPYLEILSKKGILLDPLTMNKEELYNLNVKRVAYNIPLSFIMGESDNDVYPTIDYEYLGKTYHFNWYMLSGFDSLFSDLTKYDYHITAIILNDFNEAYPEIIHPLSRNRHSRTSYYAFNTEEEKGVRAMEAAALFLSERYSGGDYGLIQDWVIANEINQQKVWNYMKTDNLDLYVRSFEKSFRTFYNAIKSNYGKANVYFSIDQDWNNNMGLNYLYFNGKDVVTKFSEIAKEGGDYNWGLSIHPYPSPLSNTKFWYGYRDKSENATIITPMNLSVVTDFMKQEDLLDTKGNIRNIGITELGFSSKSGEKVHAAAFAYCYYIIEDNPYINSFLMNRQTDSYNSLRSGLALGIYNPDYSPKYIASVYANIDSDKGKDYIPEMLEILGAKSLDEALSWAK